MAPYYSFLLSLRLQLSSSFNLVLHQAYLNAGRDEMDLATSASHIDLQGMAREAAAGNNKQANKIKIALSLYKVQQNIYLLDFQRVEVREHTHTVCLRIHPYIHATASSMHHPIFKFGFLFIAVSTFIFCACTVFNLSTYLLVTAAIMAPSLKFYLFFLASFLRPHTLIHSHTHSLPHTPNCGEASLSLLCRL